MFKPILRIAATVAVLVPASFLVAQEVEGEAEEQLVQAEATEFIFVEGSLPLIPSSNTIASKLPLSLFLTPNNVGIVSSELMREQNARVMGDALANISNVNVQPGFGVTDYFTVRGFDSLSSGLILTDGAPEPEATYWQLYNVELVEVLKGPGGFLYGSNPLAGTVNLVRKQPVDATRVGGGVGYGSFNDFEGLVDFNYGNPDSDLAFRFNALYRSTARLPRREGQPRRRVQPFSDVARRRRPSSQRELRIRRRALCARRGDSAAHHGLRCDRRPLV